LSRVPGAAHRLLPEPRRHRTRSGARRRARRAGARARGDSESVALSVIVRVLHVTPYFAPAFVYGGPPRSILGLCRALQHAHVHVGVITTTANGAGELSPDVTSSAAFGEVRVDYLQRSFPKRHFGASGLRAWLDVHAGAYDLAHVHGCWNVFGW